MGNLYRNYDTPEAKILLTGLQNTELFSRIDRFNNHIIYYYNMDFNTPVVFWYQSPDGYIFIDGHGGGILTSSGLNYVNYRLNQYHKIF